MPATEWSQAYRTVLDHVAECGPRNGAGRDEMGEYIAAVMADWPDPTKTSSRSGGPRPRTTS